jgi:eukaryotic-like serine/threonine-protein kinase
VFSKVSLVEKQTPVGRWKPVAPMDADLAAPLWVAEDGDDVAYLRTYRIRNPRVLDRVAKVARWAETVEHVTILGAREVIEVVGGLAVVSRYEEGLLLSTMLSKARRARRPFPEPVALAIALDVLESLHAAGGKLAPGWAHGGARPECVIVTRGGRARRLEVGIAALLAEVEPLAREPKWLAYGSPEQAAGRPASAASDVFSVGVMLWEMLSARPALGGLRYADIKKHLLEAEVAALTKSTTPALRAAVSRSLERDPADRFEGERSFADELRSAGKDIAEPHVVHAFLESLDAASLTERRRVLERTLGKPAPTSLPPPAPKASSQAKTVIPHLGVPPLGSLAAPSSVPRPASIPPSGHVKGGSVPPTSGSVKPGSVRPKAASVPPRPASVPPKPASVAPATPSVLSKATSRAMAAAETEAKVASAAAPGAPASTSDRPAAPEPAMPDAAASEIEVSVESLPLELSVVGLDDLDDVDDDWVVEGEPSSAGAHARAGGEGDDGALDAETSESSTLGVIPSSAQPPGPSAAATEAAAAEAAARETAASEAAAGEAAASETPAAPPAREERPPDEPAAPPNVVQDASRADPGTEPVRRAPTAPSKPTPVSVTSASPRSAPRAMEAALADDAIDELLAPPPRPRRALWFGAGAASTLVVLAIASSAGWLIVRFPTAPAAPPPVETPTPPPPVAAPEPVVVQEELAAEPEPAAAPSATSSASSNEKKAPRPASGPRPAPAPKKGAYDEVWVMPAPK